MIWWKYSHLLIVVLSCLQFNKYVAAKSAETVFEYDFDSLDDVNGFLDHASVLNLRFVSVKDRFEYRPPDAGYRPVILTDSTSINGPTKDGEKCKIPLDSSTSYFCTENSADHSKLECPTESGKHSQCNLGKFLFISHSRRTSDFYSVVGFENGLPLHEEDDHEIEFDFLINEDKCPPNTVHFHVAMYDDFSFHGVVFNSTEHSNPKNNQWNRVRQCFNLPSNSYKIHMEISNTCNSQNAFVALDNIKISRLSSDRSGKAECHVIRSTNTTDQNGHQTIFEMNFDGLGSRESLDSVGYSSNARWVNVLEYFKFATFKSEREVFVTDVSSITNVASDGADCDLPYTWMSESNYFCTENPNKNLQFQCFTTLRNFAECNMGKFLLIKQEEDDLDDSLDSTTTIFEFKSDVYLSDEWTYQVELAYFLNADSCPDNMISLNLALHDENYFQALIFDSTTTSKVESSEFEYNQILRWTSYTSCFRLPTANNYTLHVNVTNACNSARVFAAVDNIKLTKLDNNNNTNQMLLSESTTSTKPSSNCQLAQLVYQHESDDNHQSDDHLNIINMPPSAKHNYNKNPTSLLFNKHNLKQ